VHAQLREPGRVVTAAAAAAAAHCPLLLPTLALGQQQLAASRRCSGLRSSCRAIATARRTRKQRLVVPSMAARPGPGRVGAEQWPQSRRLLSPRRLPLATQQMLVVCSRPAHSLARVVDQLSQGVGLLIGAPAVRCEFLAVVVSPV
jgi:hypothetical protein